LKNIQVVDGAINSTFEIYAVTDDVFDLMFPAGQNVSFVAEVEQRRKASNIDETEFWQAVYQNKLPKTEVCGIHGTLHLTGSNVEKEYFPTRREEEVINPTR
jgi:hypothetical protein